MKNMFASDKAQTLVKNCSKWSLMNKYYEAKKAYYNGASKLTDQEFDSLERSIDAIHGKETIIQWGCVGYDFNTHLAVRTILTSLEDLLAYELSTVREKCLNDKVVVTKIIEKLDKIEIIEKVINYTANELGQLSMGF